MLTGGSGAGSSAVCDETWRDRIDLEVDTVHPAFDAKQIREVVGDAPAKGKRAARFQGELALLTDVDARKGGESKIGLINPNRKIFEARKRETAALGAGEKLVLGHPLAATIGDSARCMQNLEKVLFTGPKTSDTVTFICD